MSSHSSSFLKSKNFVIFFIYCLVGLALFGQTLFVDFRWDDQYQIVEPPIVHSITNIPLLFLTGIREEGSNGLLFDHFYRPIYFSAYATLYMIGGGWAFSFHFFQVVLHVGNSFLLLILFRRFFHSRIAFFLALIFLVHPISQEVVVYIANLNEVLSFFFGVSGLLLITSSRLSRLRVITAFFLFFFSLLSKETGVLYLLLWLAYVGLFQKKRLNICIKGIGIVLFTYLLLRMLGAFHYFLQYSIYSTGFTTRLMYIPVLFSYYIKELFLPSDVITQHHSTMPIISQGEFTISVLFCVVVFVVVGVYCKTLWKISDMRKALVFFGIWVVIGLGLHLQIIQLDQFVAKRWLYFPLAGMLGLLGVGTERYYADPRLRPFLVGLGIVLLTFFIMQTLKMNGYWMDERLLMQHVSWR